MGWLYQSRSRGMSHQDYFAREFPSLEILDCATVGGTFYAAVRSPKMPEQVWALIVLTRMCPKDRYNFGYKDMDETMGPYESKCPGRILDLLTPLEPGKYPHAEEWRARCRTYANRVTPKVGQTVALVNPVYFGGIPEKTLTKVSLPRRRDVYRTGSGRLVRLPRLKNYEYSILPQGQN
jgi:hypothetical protein